MSTITASAPKPSALQIVVVGARSGTQVQMVPGKTYVSLPPDSIDTIALAELVPAGDGTWRLVARICPRWFTVTKANLKRLGVSISDQSLARLIRAKFVRGRKITPRCIEFDYFDFMRHQAAVEADDEFWERTEPGQAFSNEERHRQAL